ncbi:hypothetical protein M0R89_17830 [Halorussus limi]|uniref:Uncharacterized protein n=1 Tax=Halorussus limi TaxID=2938695 RepID=A0A8U0HTP3_9EURY|nr:hypothetical protein [Halorussus limi]UPV74380.1 hypothetical protein M0R89_17830 [Halorussus limi]
MQTIELLYVVFSATLATAGLSMVGLAVRAYHRTSRQAMFHLSVGFTLIVAAAIATTVSAFVTHFGQTRMLLTVNYLITTIGYLFVIYSITANE